MLEASDHRTQNNDQGQGQSCPNKNHPRFGRAFTSLETSRVQCQCLFHGLHTPRGQGKVRGPFGRQYVYRFGPPLTVICAKFCMLRSHCVWIVHRFVWASHLPIRILPLSLWRIEISMAPKNRTSKETHDTTTTTTENKAGDGNGDADMRSCENTKTLLGHSLDTAPYEGAW